MFDAIPRPRAASAARVQAQPVPKTASVEPVSEASTPPAVLVHGAAVNCHDLVEVFHDAEELARTLVRTQKSIGLLGDKAPPDLAQAWATDASGVLERLADAMMLVRERLCEPSSQDERDPRRNSCRG